MEFADGKILAEIKDGVGRITFNQPEKRNAMSVTMWAGMGQALDIFEADASGHVDFRKVALSSPQAQAAFIFVAPG